MDQDKGDDENEDCRGVDDAPRNLFGNGRTDTESYSNHNEVHQVAPRCARANVTPSNAIRSVLVALPEPNQALGAASHGTTSIVHDTDQMARQHGDARTDADVVFVGEMRRIIDLTHGEDMGPSSETITVKAEERSNEGCRRWIRRSKRLMEHALDG